MKKLSKRDKAALLGVDNSTLYNWRKHKPNLYRIVMLGFEFDALLEQMRQNADELERIDEKIRQEIQAFGGKMAGVLTRLDTAIIELRISGLTQEQTSVVLSDVFFRYANEYERAQNAINTACDTYYKEFAPQMSQKGRTQRLPKICPQHNPRQSRASLYEQHKQGQAED